MFTIISFFQRLIKGVGIRAGGLENIFKIDKRKVGRLLGTQEYMHANADASFGHPE